MNCSSWMAKCQSRLGTIWDSSKRAQTKIDTLYTYPHQLTDCCLIFESPHLSIYPRCGQPDLHRIYLPNDSVTTTTSVRTTYICYTTYIHLTRVRCVGRTEVDAFSLCLYHHVGFIPTTDRKNLDNKFPPSLIVQERLRRDSHYLQRS